MLTLSLAASLAAQNLDGPYWTEYALPAAGVTQFRSTGTTAYIQTPVGYHFYSGFTRQWVQQATSAAAAAQLANSYAMVQDGTTFHGYCSRTGAVATLVASPAATLQIGTASASWICYVRDGNTVYGYSGFHGQWVPLTPANPIVSVQLGAHTIVVNDGSTAYAMSPYFGTWVGEPVRAAGVYSTFNAGALVRWGAPDEVKGFSAYHNTWASASFAGAPAATVVGQEGYALLQTGAGSDTLAFSALRGAFLQLTLPGGTTWATGPDVAIASGPGYTFGYAPGVDAFVTLPVVNLAQQPQVAQGRFGSYALLDTGSSLVAFQGLTGAIATAPTYASGYSFAIGDVAAFAAAPGGGGQAYSALTNTFVPSPTALSLIATPMFESVVLSAGADFYGFSARKGSWSSVPANGTLVAPNAASLAFVQGSNGIDAYDPVLARWNHLTTPGPTTTSVFRLLGIAHDGTTGWGYSLFTNAWDSIALQGTVTSISASSSIASIRTSSHIYMFTGNGSLSNLGRFPEFSRFVVRGAQYESIQAAPPGSFVVQAIGPDIEAPSPYGTLRVDLNAADIYFLGVVPASGLLRTIYPLPDTPAFSGLSVGLQDAILPPSGGIYLTNGQVPYVW